MSHVRSTELACSGQVLFPSRSLHPSHHSCASPGRMSQEREPLLSDLNNDRPADYQSRRDGVDNAEQHIEQGEPAKGSYMAFVRYPCAFPSQKYLRSSQVLPMAVGIFLCAMDGTIVVSCESSPNRRSFFVENEGISAAAAIGSELNELQNTSWIATAYLLTLTSFQYALFLCSKRYYELSCSLQASLRKAERYLRAQELFTVFLFNLFHWMFAVRPITEHERTYHLQSIRWDRWWGNANVSHHICSQSESSLFNLFRIVSIIMSDVVPLRSRGTWQGWGYSPTRRYHF